MAPSPVRIVGNSFGEIRDTYRPQSFLFNAAKCYLAPGSMHVSYLALTAARQSACFRVSLCSRNSRSQAVIPHFDSLLQMSAWAGLLFAIALSAAPAVRGKRRLAMRHPPKRITSIAFKRLMFKISPPILFVKNQGHPVFAQYMGKCPRLFPNILKEYLIFPS